MNVCDDIRQRIFSFVWQDVKTSCGICHKPVEFKNGVVWDSGIRLLYPTPRMVCVKCPGFSSVTIRSNCCTKCQSPYWLWSAIRHNRSVWDFSVWSGQEQSRNVYMRAEGETKSSVQIKLLHKLHSLVSGTWNIYMDVWPRAYYKTWQEDCRLKRRDGQCFVAGVTIWVSDGKKWGFIGDADNFRHWLKMEDVCKTIKTLKQE